MATMWRAWGWFRRSSPVNARHPRTFRRTYGAASALPTGRRPWYYGIAYWEWDAVTAVCYPLGVHLLVRVWRRWHG